MYESMRKDYSYTVLLNMALKHSSEGKSSKLAEFETGYLIIYFVWKEK